MGTGPLRAPLRLERRDARTGCGILRYAMEVSGFWYGSRLGQLFPFGAANFKYRGP